MKNLNSVRFTLLAATFALAVAILAPASASAADAPTGKTVNLNTASVEQLSHLPRVGTKLAERIVDYRKSSGGFKKAEELMGVKGIGEKMFESIRPYVTISGDTTLTEEVRLPRKSEQKAKDAAKSERG